MTTRKVPPGWYEYDDHQRYWDGERWTEYEAPLRRSDSDSATAAILVGIVGVFALLIFLWQLGVI